MHEDHLTCERVREDEAPKLKGGRVGSLALKAVAGAVAFLVVGNLAILAASMWARETTAKPAPAEIGGIENLVAVDNRMWRGGAPSTEGYAGLANAGVTTVIDLRAEEGIEHDFEAVGKLGMNLVHIPIRDGQTPSTAEVDAFLTAARQSDGTIFVHCGAGVGRTGAMVGAYQVAMGELSGTDALRRNLAVGPPSLEQILFVGRMDEDKLEKPNAVLTAVSRVLDAPRRIWSRVG